MIWLGNFFVTFFPTTCLWLITVCYCMKGVQQFIYEIESCSLRPEIINVGVVTIDLLSIGIKFKNSMQVGFRDQGLHRRRTVYCQNPISLPKLVLFFGTFLELLVLPSIICDSDTRSLCDKIIHIMQSRRNFFGKKLIKTALL